MIDLLYCGEKSEYDSIQKDIKGKFPEATFEDGSDDIHEYRFQMNLPDEKRKEYVKFTITKGFAAISFWVQMAMHKQSLTDSQHQLLLDVIKELQDEGVLKK